MSPISSKLQNPGQTHDCGQFDADESQRSFRAVRCCKGGSLSERKKENSVRKLL